MIDMQPDFQAATSFIWLNARLIDRYRFAHQFQDGSPANVLAALKAYQNPDGGFGNALEPDLRAPNSQPQPIELALHILDELDAFDDAMVTRACDYLLKITTSEGGVPFVLPSANAYPSAPWWHAEPNPPAALNPTAAVAGLLHKHRIEHAWLGSATDFCWRTLARDEALGGYDFLCVFGFLEHVPDRRRADAVFERQAAALLDSPFLALDPGAEGHVFMPLDFAPSPHSPQRRLFADDVIERHVDALARRQQPDGGWPISWQPPSALAELEWRASRTVRALTVLRAYGRM